MKNEISISAVLMQIDITVQDSEPVFFSIEFYKKGTGKNDKERGKIISLGKASKNFKDPKFQTASAGATSENKREIYRLKEQGIILIFDHEFYKRGHKTGYTAIPIDLIRSFNGMPVKH
jgi:hypothetical protein